MGHRVGGLQLFTGMGEQTGRVLWSRTGGQGWRSTQVTLWGGGFESVSVGAGLMGSGVGMEVNAGHTMG